MNIVTEYHQTIASLQKAKPRSNQRIKLQSRATDLLTKILRKQNRTEKKNGRVN